jgi:hypothetical protein
MQVNVATRLVTADLAVFRVINNVAMKLVGGEFCQKIIDQELDFVEGFVGAHVS